MSGGNNSSSPAATYDTPTSPSKLISDPISSYTSPTQQQQQQPTEAATKLVEAIDDFLLDIEKKFRTISDEILTKLDDMAERCDRLEADMLTNEITTNGGGLGARKESLSKKDDHDDQSGREMYLNGSAASMGNHGTD